MILSLSVERSDRCNALSKIMEFIRIQIRKVVPDRLLIVNVLARWTYEMKNVLSLYYLTNFDL